MLLDAKRDLGLPLVQFTLVVFVLCNSPVSLLIQDVKPI
jgi:hypothetical protein